AVASQLAPTKRMATGLAAGVLVIAFALRTAAAISGAGLGWLRWTSPLGWGEALRPFADPKPIVLLPLVATGGLLLAVAAALAVGRDIGRGLLPTSDRAAPPRGPLGEPAGPALRSARGAVGAWGGGGGAVAPLRGGRSGRA